MMDTDVKAVEDRSVAARKVKNWPHALDLSCVMVVLLFLLSTMVVWRQGVVKQLAANLRFHVHIIVNVLLVVSHVLYGFSS